MLKLDEINLEGHWDAMKPYGMMNDGQGKVMTWFDLRKKYDVKAKLTMSFAASTDGAHGWGVPSNIRGFEALHRGKGHLRLPQLLKFRGYIEENRCSRIR